jgi:hypothetical protein
MPPVLAQIQAPAGFACKGELDDRAGAHGEQPAGDERAAVRIAVRTAVNTVHIHVQQQVFTQGVRGQAEARIRRRTGNEYLAGRERVLLDIALKAQPGKRLHGVHRGGRVKGVSAQVEGRHAADGDAGCMRIQALVQARFPAMASGTGDVS